MILAIYRSEYFKQDFDRQYRWYLDHAGEVIAGRFLENVLATLRLLAQQPDLGRRRNFRHPRLQEIRSFRLAPPFTAHLVFYRHNSTELFVERLMHGARDLPRRLTEEPEEPTDS